MVVILKGTRTGAHPDGDRRKGQRQPAPGIQAALGHPIQLLPQRQALGTACSCACARTFRSPRGSASISTTGWRTACARRRSISSSARTLSSDAASRTPAGTRRFAHRTDLLQCGQKWLTAFTPFFTARERREAGCQHRLFFAQVEYCDNLIFFRRAALDELAQRLLDVNRTIGQPKKITIIFGRKVTKQYHGKLQTEIEDMDLPNPVIRSHYGNGFIKQYVRDHLLLRTEPATNNVRRLRSQQGCREPARTPPAHVGDHRQLPERPAGHSGDVRRPRSTAQTRRTDDPRPMASAFPASSSIIRGNWRSCTPWCASPISPPATLSLRRTPPRRLEALGAKPSQYTPASFRYDLSKLRAKGLVEKLPHSRRYRLVGKGYSVCLIFLKLFERIYAPLTAGLLKPFPGDRKLAEQKRCTLDRLYQRIVDDLDELLRAVGLKTAA